MAAASLEVRVPDLGEVEEVDVVEILVRPGERVEVDDGLLTLESEKASMDIPSPLAGMVREVRVEVGHKVRQGDVVAVIDAEEEPAEKPATEEPATEEPAAAAGEEAAGERVATGGKHGEPARAGREPEARRPAAVPPPEERRGSAPGRSRLVVLGGGPGGYTAAFRAADLGLEVTLVEREATLGGVCLNVGCIPSKALLHAARVIEEAAAFAERGIVFGEPRLELGKLRAWKDAVVARSTKGLSALARQRGVRVLRGSGRLVGPHELEVESGEGTQRLAFEQAILAPGSRVARIPGIPYDDPRVIDSTGALALEEVPGRLLVVGGGIIGLEMATVYAALGARLTIVELTPGLMPGTDPDLVRPLEKRLRERFGAEIHLGTRVAAVEAQKKGLEVSFEGEGAPAATRFDRVLVAVGRRPNGDAIGAEAAGLAVDAKGFIPVDRQQRSNVPHLFAIGDAVSPPMLAHKATHEGRVAAEVCAGLPASFDARVIPSVAYTDPEIAWVGLTETAAREEGIAYEKATFPWSASGRAGTLGRPDGATKLLFDPETRRLLGAGIVGVGAGDLIAEAALAIEMDCEAADLGLTIHPHPTLSETLAFAAEVFDGTVTDLYLGAKKREAG